MNESTDCFDELVALFREGDRDALEAAFEGLSDSEKFRLFARLDRERHEEIYEALARE
jgi:hypothetical protein